MDLDARPTSWLHTRTGAIEGRTVIAVDGKTMRGARTADNPAPHPPAAPDQVRGVVVARRRVADKFNEIPALPELLAPLDLDGAPITADATAHPQGHRRVDPQSRRPPPADGQGQPARSAPDAQGPAPEGRPGPVHPRRLPRAAGAAHPQGRPGPPVGGLPRRRPGDPDPAHPHHQGQEAGRGGPPGSARFPWIRPGPRPLRPGSAAIGASRTAPTGSGTWSRARTATNCAPATDL